MSDFTDHELRSRFEQLRAADAASAPDLRELFDGADRESASARRIERRALPRLAVPIALAAAVFVIAAVVGVARRRAPVQAPLSTWTSPTASLLRTPSLGLLAPPNMLSSALATSLLTNGTRR